MNGYPDDCVPNSTTEPSGTADGGELAVEYLLDCVHGLIVLAI